MLLLLSKLLITASVVGLLRCSSDFRRMSRELDQQALSALKRAMHASEDCGMPANALPVLILVTALCYMLSSYVTAVVAR